MAEVDTFTLTVTTRDEWVSAIVEDKDGAHLGEAIAPIVEGATFDSRAAVVRAAIEDALAPESVA